MEKVSQFVARLFLGHIFLLAGISKISAYEGTQGYMDAMGVPGMLLPLVILLEVGAGLAVIVGWKTRWAAIALAGFTVVSAVIFHNNFGDQMQMIMFMKNIAISGGLMLLAVHGAGAYSLDNHRTKATTATTKLSHS
jgi:putative oxidoreductase